MNNQILENFFNRHEDEILEILTEKFLTYTYERNNYYGFATDGEYAYLNDDGFYCGFHKNKGVLIEKLIPVALGDDIEILKVYPELYIKLLKLLRYGHERFPRLEYRDNIVAFIDGYLNLEDLSFQDYPYRFIPKMFLDCKYPKHWKNKSAEFIKNYIYRELIERNSL